MPGDESNSAKEKLLRCMGRNLILFQGIEHTLKGLISLGSISASSRTDSDTERRKDQTLGQVAESFIRRHLSGEPPVIPEVVPRDEEIIFQSSFHIGGGVSVDLAQRIQRAIPDRNRLAHLLIQDFDLTSDAGRETAVAWLDESHTEHSRLFEMLQEFHRSLREAFHSVTTFLQSDQGRTQLIFHEVQRLPIVGRLQKRAASTSKTQEWVRVADAAKFECKTELRKTLAHFELKSLTELMVVSRLFDLKAEETGSGGTRMLYRVFSQMPPAS